VQAPDRLAGWLATPAARIDHRTMTEMSAEGAQGQAADSAAAPARPPRRHRILVGTLFVLATVVGFMALQAVWVNRQALNTDNWTSTSSQLLANKEIQAAVSAYAVNQLFSSGVPQAELKSALPTKLQPLAGPVSSGLEQLAGQVAPRVLASPQVQTAWRTANRAAHATLVKIINGGNKLASTKGGVVTLDLHAIITQLAAALGVQQQVAAGLSALKANAGKVKAGASQLGVTLPASSGQLVILRSSQLRTAQDIAGGIKGSALVLPLLAFALFALAVWLSRGRRREGLRLTGWCFVGVGLLTLIGRRIAGNEVIDGLVKNPAYRPAAHQVWAIASTLLYDIAAAVIVYGLVIVAAAWLAGHTRLATAVRRALAPTLRERPAATYIVVYILLLLVILWGPTPATRQLPYIIGFIVLLGLGVHALRRETAREFPNAQAGDSGRSARAWYSDRRSPVAVTATTVAAGRNGEHLAELERLAMLHDSGSLTDQEFAAEKAVLMNGA
jgi:hypothetical protein